MFIIDKNSNTISKVPQKSFSELGFKERDHLQEWIARYPESLGEELLIIQKEFAGFSDTNERLDLLALDKQGNIVVIENKLDDSGKDVTWQVMKYASYCSSLSKTQIKNIFQEYLDKSGSTVTAEDAISDFFDGSDFEEVQLNKGQTQRIIMVAGNFRKEVTSTVLWLLNYKLRIQCFKTTPFQFNDQLFINFEQIIPMKEAEEYSISMAEKTQDDIDSQEQLKSRHIIRKDFWKKLLPVMNSKSNLFQNISPSHYHWIGAGSGVRGVGFNFVASKSYGRCEIYIDRGDRQENKFVFDLLLSKRDEIESIFGGTLTWERLDEKRASRIKYESLDFNIFDRDCWDDMIEFMTDGMQRFEKAFKAPFASLNKEIKTNF